MLMVVSIIMLVFLNVIGSKNDPLFIDKLVICLALMILEIFFEYVMFDHFYNK